MKSLKSMNIIEFSLILGAVLITALSLKNCRDNERISIIRLGKFVGLKGPGYVITLPVIDKSNKLTTGQKGILISKNIVKVNSIEIPVIYDDDITIGSEIRIMDFKGSKGEWSQAVITK